MKWNDVVQVVLSFVIFTLVVSIISVILAGCSDRQPTRVAWLSVEKAPIKIVYIDRQGELDKNITEMIFGIVHSTKYRRIPMNDSTSIKLEASSFQSDTESDSDISSMTIAR